ncbi:hypothetical protein ACFL02_07115 [Planctomycetota bacterium]
MESDLNQIRQRLRSLEKQNRNMKMIGFTVIILALAGLFIWSMKNLEKTKKSKIIEAQEFVLVDPARNIRAKLAFRENCPALIMYDRQQNERVVMDQSDIGGSLCFFDNRENLRIYFGQVRNNFDLIFRDTRGNPRATMGFIGGEGLLAIFDENRIPLWSALKTPRQK